MAGLGLAFVSLSVGQSGPMEAALTGLFGPMFLLLACSDLRSRTIPNAIFYPSLVLALLLSWAWPERGSVDTLGGGIGASIGASWTRGLSSGGPVGGDVKMAALVGSVVGYPAIMLAGAVTGLAGGILAVALLATSPSFHCTVAARRLDPDSGPQLRSPRPVLGRVWFGA